VRRTAAGVAWATAVKDGGGLARATAARATARRRPKQRDDGHGVSRWRGSEKEVNGRRKEARLAMPYRKGFHGRGLGSARLGTRGGKDKMLRAKALASTLAGGDGGGAFVVLPRGGVILELHPYCTGFFG
jgi:hypothetical protein